MMTIRGCMHVRAVWLLPPSASCQDPKVSLVNVVRRAERRIDKISEPPPSPRVECRACPIDYGAVLSLRVRSIVGVLSSRSRRYFNCISLCAGHHVRTSLEL